MEVYFMKCEKTIILVIKVESINSRGYLNTIVNEIADNLREHTKIMRRIHGVWINTNVTIGDEVCL